MVQGKRKEFTGYSPKIGFFQAEVIAVNPTLEQLNTFTDISNMKEPDYNKDYEDKNNDNATYKQAIVTFYLKMHDGTIQPKRFPVIDKPRINKDSSKAQFINTIGNTTWATNEEALHEAKYAWFTKREYRKALTGEEKLYNFLQKWLSLDWKDPDTQLSIDTSKLFNGKFKELQEIIDSPDFKEAKIVGYATIHTTIPAPTEEIPEPNPKYYQNIWDEFLPGNAWRYLHIEPIPGTTFDVPLWKTTLPNWIQDYVNTMTGEYGSKDYLGKTVDNQLQIEELRDFSPSENLIARGSSIHNDSSTASITSSETATDSTILDDLPF